MSYRRTEPLQKAFLSYSTDQVLVPLGKYSKKSWRAKYETGRFWTEENDFEGSGRAQSSSAEMTENEMLEQENLIKLRFETWCMMGTEHWSGRTKGYKIREIKQLVSDHVSHWHELRTTVKFEDRMSILRKKKNLVFFEMFRSPTIAKSH